MPHVRHHAIRRTTTLALAAASAAALAAPVAARGQPLGPNIVTNGDFEAEPPLAGWLRPQGAAQVYRCDRAGSGPRAACLFPFGVPGLVGAVPVTELAQALATQAGETYRISFSASARPLSIGVPTFTTFFGGLVVNVVTADRFASDFTFDVLATGTSTTLLFRHEFTQPPCPLCDDYGSVLTIDNVRVQRVIPEPATVVLVAAGAIGVAGLARRRRSG